jgi:tetratricopeptide (TPR) repeat protein
MLGLSRWFVFTIALILVAGQSPSQGQDTKKEPAKPAPAPAATSAPAPVPAKPEAPQNKDSAKPEAKPAPAAKPTPADFALQNEDPPALFVPKTPRTVADQKKLEALRLYTEARSLEDNRQLSQAITVLEKALASDPESLPILKRLTRLSLALGRTDKSVEYSRKVLALEPSDSETVVRLVDFYKTRKRDNAKAEALLKEVLANPKLDKSSSAAVLLEYEQAKLFAMTQKFETAASSLARVLDALDNKNGLKLTADDTKRILGNDEAQAYFQFGMIFLAAKKLDLAISAFQHGLSYDKDDPQLTFALAETFLEANRSEEALALLEQNLKGPGASKQVYALLIQVLTKLKREKEIIPRLEEAFKADPRNAPLSYALAERYRAAGQGEKADNLLKSLIDTEPGLQGFSSLFASLLKDKKSEDLIQLLVKVSVRMRREDAIVPQIQALIADPVYTDKVLDTGLTMLAANPSKLDRSGWFILLRIATTAKKLDKVVALLRWSLKIEQDPMVWRELARTLSDQSKFSEAEAELEAMMKQLPKEKNQPTLLFLAQIRVRAHKEAAAIAVLNELLKEAPEDPDVLRLLAYAMQQNGQVDQAVAKLKDALKKSPGNIDLIRSLAGVYQQSGKSQENIEFLKGVLERDPNNDELVKFARANLSIAYTSLGDYAKGEAELEILFAKEPNDPGVNNDLGYLYTEQGKNLEKAESMIRKAVADEPDNSSYLDSLGWVLFKRGKIKEAIAPLEKALEHLVADDATVHEHLGDVYFAAKERAKAKAAWEKAEKIASAAKPVDKRLSEIRKKLESLKSLDKASSPSSGKNP